MPNLRNKLSALRDLVSNHHHAPNTILLKCEIRMFQIDHGKVLAAGTIEELKEQGDETLEDVFIRLVGASIEEIEGQNEEE